MSRRAHAPSTRRLISSVNAAWNGERTDCSSSEATASPTASRTPPQIPLPAPRDPPDGHAGADHETQRQHADHQIEHRSMRRQPGPPREAAR